MAKVALGSGVSSITGKVAGNVFQRSRAGQIVRNWAKTPAPYRDATFAQRRQIAYWSNAWRQGTDEQRAAWTSYASTSTSTFTKPGQKYQSGQQAFVGWNKYRTLQGPNPHPWIPPAPPPPPDKYPLTVPGLISWWETGQLYTDYDMTIPAIAGDQVRRWKDIGPAENHLTGVIPDHKPYAIQADALLGIDCRSEDRWLENTAITFPLILTVFAQTTWTSGFPFFIESGPNVNTDNGFFCYGSDSSPWSVRRTPNQQSASAPASWSLGTNQILEFHLNSVPDVLINGDSVITGTIGTFPSPSNAPGSFFLGARNGVAWGMAAQVFNLLIYAGLPTPTELQGIRDYLAGL